MAYQIANKINDNMDSNFKRLEVFIDKCLKILKEL